MKLLILADGYVGSKVCDYLIKNFFEDIGMIVTTSDNEIRQKALAHKIQTCINVSSEILAEEIKGYFDLGVLAWWPQIICESLVQKARLGFINMHPSLLPYNRGKNYNFWTLVEKNPFGVSLHRVDKGIDSGDIISQKEIPYDWTDNGESLYLKARDAMIDLFKETYSDLIVKIENAIPQNLSLGSFHNSSELEAASKIELENQYKGEDLINLMRARTFTGYPGCWFEADGCRYEVTISIRKL